MGTNTHTRPTPAHQYIKKIYIYIYIHTYIHTVKLSSGPGLAGLDAEAIFCKFISHFVWGRHLLAGGWVAHGQCQERPLPANHLYSQGTERRLDQILLSHSTRDCIRVVDQGHTVGFSTHDWLAFDLELQFQEAAGTKQSRTFSRLQMEEKLQSALQEQKGMARLRRRTRRNSGEI